MSEPVELSVRSELKKIIAELEQIAKKADSVGDGLSKTGEKIGDELNKQTKRTETFLTRLRSLGSRVSGQLKDDFRSLLSLNALKESLSLSENFKGTVKQGLELTDTIRKFGRTLGVVDSNWVKFQSSLVRGLGEVGLGAEVATENIKALANTPVRGQQNILGYSLVSGQIASATGARGSEGEISKLISQVIQASGGNPNDMKKVNAVGSDVTRVFQQTGGSALQTLSTMNEIFTAMPSGLRKIVSTTQLSQLAAASQAAGPGSTKFLEEFLSKSFIDRMAMEHLGLGGTFTKNGIDMNRLGKNLKGVTGMIGMDPEKSAGILGLSAEGATGAVRFAENIDKVKQAMTEIGNQSGDFAKLRKESMGISEALGASVNRLKAFVSPLTSAAGHGAANLLSHASESAAGSAAVVAGGGILAALLAGAGLKGIGKGLGKGIFGKALGVGQAAATESLTGEKVVPVYVTNANEIGGGLAGLGAAAGGIGLGTVAAGGAAIAGGAAVGYALQKPYRAANDWIEEKLHKGLDAIGLRRDSFSGGGSSTVNHQIHVELKSKSLKEVKPATRGASFGATR